MEKNTSHDAEGNARDPDRGAREPSHSGRLRRLRRRYLRFLNTPLGIFLLSTVLVGTMSFLWTSVSEWRKQDVARQLQIRKLRAEISARTNRCYYLVQGDYRKPTGVAVDQRLRQLGISGAPDTAIVFPEFRDRSLNSLFWELNALRGIENVDWHSAQHGVVDILETGRLANEAARTLSVPLRGDHAVMMMYLEMLRNSEPESYAIASEFRVDMETRHVSDEEHEEYVRRRWPEFAKMMDKIRAEDEAEKKRKEEILRKSLESEARTSTSTSQ